MTRLALAALAALALSSTACSQAGEPNKTNPAPANPPAPSAGSPGPTGPAERAGAPAKPTVPVPPGATLFVKRAPAPGDTCEEKVAMTMSMETSVDPEGKGTPQKATMEKVEVETRREEVLAVKGDAVTKVKVTFVEKSSSLKEGGKERKRPSPVEGKTYVVESKGGSVVALLGGELPAPVQQARAVKEAFEMLGKVDPLYAGIPERPLKPGDVVPELAKAMKEFVLLRAKEMQVSDVKVVFRGERGDEGVFDIEVGLSAVEKPLRFDMKLKGEARMSLKTGQPLGTVLKGPLSVSSTEGEGSKMKISGSGTVEMRMERKKL